MQGAQVGHDGGSARDRIGEVIVVDGVTEPLLVRPRRLLSKPLYGRAIGRFDEIEQGKMRMRFEQLLTVSGEPGLVQVRRTSVAVVRKKESS